MRSRASHVYGDRFQNILLSCDPLVSCCSRWEPRKREAFHVVNPAGGIHADLSHVGVSIARKGNATKTTPQAAKQRECSCGGEVNPRQRFRRAIEEDERENLRQPLGSEIENYRVPARLRNALSQLLLQYCVATHEGAIKKLFSINFEPVLANIQRIAGRWGNPQ